MEPEKITSRLTAEEARELVFTPERILEIIYQQIREKAQAAGRDIFVQKFGFDRIFNEAGQKTYTRTQQIVIDTLIKDRYEVVAMWASNCIDSGIDIKW